MHNITEAFLLLYYTSRPTSRLRSGHKEVKGEQTGNAPTNAV